jgi:hypothetical protein
MASSPKHGIVTNIQQLSEVSGYAKPNLNVLKDVLKDDALSRIELPIGSTAMKVPVNYIRDCRYVKHKIIFDIITRYNERQPILIIYFKNKIGHVSLVKMIGTYN